MNDIAYQLYNCPPFTKYYLTMLVVSSFLINYISILPVYWYFAFSIKQIVNNFQIWRIFTNFLIGGKFSLGYLIMLYSLFTALSSLEHQGINNKALSKFYSQIFYLIFLIIIISFFDKYVLHIKESRSLINELSYSFSALNAYRDPEVKRISIYLIPVKNRYAPIALFFISVCSGNAATPILVGFVAGYLYVFLGDFMEEKFGFSLFYVPKFVQRYFRDKEIKRKIEDENINLYNKETKKEETVMMHDITNSTNSALRKKESVIEGNEFKKKEINKNNIKWD